MIKPIRVDLDVDVTLGGLFYYYCFFLFYFILFL